MGVFDCTLANVAAFFSATENVDSETSEPLVALKRNHVPSGDQALAMCDVPVPGERPIRGRF